METEQLKELIDKGNWMDQLIDRDGDGPAEGEGQWALGDHREARDREVRPGGEAEETRLRRKLKRLLLG